MSDRRRINGPSAGTTPPVFVSNRSKSSHIKSTTPYRSRPNNALRKIFLKTGVTPSASGSAYLELESSASTSAAASPSNVPPRSGLKLTCTVHGPRPLPRSAPFTPHLFLSTHVKYAPFATSKRRGFIRDAGERDLSVHLETALRGVIIGDRWPKSGVEVIVTILEGEESQTGTGASESKMAGQWSLMSVLSGCITVASAAIADAGIDCVDVVSGGVAALVHQTSSPDVPPYIVLDPVPSEHASIVAACVVGYLPSRDEVTDLWNKGHFGGKSQAVNASFESLMDGAIQAAIGAHRVLSAALQESAANLANNG